MDKLVKTDCANCLNSQGYSWDCDKNPKRFEPEHKFVDVPGKNNTVTSDYSDIPKDRVIYCRMFIPEGNKSDGTVAHWDGCNYINGKWYRR